MPLARSVVKTQLLMKMDIDWVMLSPGLGHEESNMIKGFIEINGEVLMRSYAKTQGKYTLEKALAFFK